MGYHGKQSKTRKSPWNLKTLTTTSIVRPVVLNARGCSADSQGGIKEGQTACKPGSVHAPSANQGGDGWPFLWDARYRAPRATDPGGDAETPLPVARRAAPIWSCSRWGLPCRSRCRSRGGLLPHRFTLAGPANRAGGLFSVALSLGSPPPDVIRHRVSVEPGLSSPYGCPHGAAIRPSDPHAVARLRHRLGQGGRPIGRGSRCRRRRRPCPA